MKKIAACIGLLASCLVLTFVAYVNYDVVVGAFGEGPPYYGRSTNMDKWENPLPMLILVDALTLIVAAVLLRWSVKALR